MESRNLSIAILLSTAVVMTIAGALGGPHSATDQALLHRMMAVGDDVSWVDPVAIALAYLGSALMLIPIAIVGVAFLAWEKRWQDMTIFLTVTIGGRLLIEILKVLVGRPRPDFEPYAVPVSSLSFPSGHAGNTMLTFLAIATIIVGERWRNPAIPVAIAASIIVGLSRPVLGVHWPSDVLAGWMFGIGLTVACLASFNRGGSAT